MLWLSKKASNDRDWSPDNAVLPRVHIDGDTVRVQGVRCFRYRTTRDYDEAWHEREFSLSALDQLDFFVAPFNLVKGWKREGGKAHTFVSFGFGDEHIAISIEVRRVAGDSFDALRGLFRGFELMYVFADESDVVGVRTHAQNATVYMFPVSTSRDNIKAMFLDMARRANQLYATPEFYNTLTNTCTTNLVRHVNTITPGRIGLSHHVLLPGYSARRLYRLGLIDTDRSLDETLELCRIDPQAVGSPYDPKFSARLRACRHLPRKESSS